ncbi:MAG: RidA family protein [Microbacteriaceae bacterium]
MEIQEIVSEDLAAPNGNFAQAMKVTGAQSFVFVSGMTARNKEGGVTGVGDVVAQTHQVCQNIKSVLEAAGGEMKNIMRVDVYVRNMEDFKASHEVRKMYFPQNPASTMVEVSKFVNKDYLIEINAIAVI